MNFSVKPNPFFAIFIPGAILLLAIFLFSPSIMLFYTDYYVQMDISKLTIILFVVFICSIVVGQIVESVRDIIEIVLDKIKNNTINWDFFVLADENRVNRLAEWYYTYYQMNFNICIVIIAVLLSNFFGFLEFHNITVFYWAVFVFLIMASSVYFVRKEIVHLTNVGIIKYEGTHKVLSNRRFRRKMFKTRR